MIYSNLSEVKNHLSTMIQYRNVICLDETLAFLSDMTIGNAVAPFQLTGTSSTPSGGSSELYCADEVPGGWVPDCTDPEQIVQPMILIIVAFVVVAMLIWIVVVNVLGCP